MPQVKVFGNLRDHVTEPRFEMSGTTVRELLLTLCAGNDALCNAILEDNVLRPYVRVMLNGRDIELAQGIDTPVSDSDQLAIFPPLAGG